MDNKSNIKMSFSKSLSEELVTDCESYDKMYGCNMDCPIFDGIGVKTEVGRYHSLVIDEESLPNCLNITARSDDDCIMGVQHNERPVYGIQFHPESVLTPNGMKMIENFLNI